jgi:hypothetical protein
MSIGLQLRIDALEARATAVEILTAEIFAQLFAAVEVNQGSFEAGLMDLARKYRFDEDESDPGRRAAGLQLSRILDAWHGRAITD